jgi:hypothetical protein
MYTFEFSRDLLIFIFTSKQLFAFTALFRTDLSVVFPLLSLCRSRRYNYFAPSEFSAGVYDLSFPLHSPLCSQMKVFVSGVSVSLRKLSYFEDQGMFLFRLVEKSEQELFTFCLMPNTLSLPLIPGPHPQISPISGEI